jgi:peroxiredoxin
MKTFCFIISFFFITGLAAQTGKVTGFVLNGTITGIKDGTVVKLEDANKNSEITKSVIQKGKFTLKGKLDEPSLCWLKITGEDPQYIYLENKTISVAGSKPVKNNLNVTGSALQKDFKDFEQSVAVHMGRVQNLVNEINNLPYGPKRDSLMNIYNAAQDSVQKNIDSYIDRHPASHVSIFMLFVTSQYYENPSLLQKRYLRLDAATRAYPMGISLNNFIDYNMIGSVGTKAVDFTQPDTSGIPVSLSSFKGKYVLVDFWASWCGPCRMENPNVVANYQKFKDKNFTVLGVSLDRPGQKEAWMNAIYKDNLTWTHVSDLQFWNNAAAKLYRVTGIPYNFLMDPEGKIIASKLRGSDLQAKLCEILGCN